MKEITITSILVCYKERIEVTADEFGIRFPLNIEPAVYSIAGNIASEYNGAYWEFYRLSNSGFYMAPCTEQSYQVSCENGFEGKLSADALGITSCLYAYSHFSFISDMQFAEKCAKHYHWLREYMLQHPEASMMLRAID